MVLGMGAKRALRLYSLGLEKEWRILDLGLVLDLWILLFFRIFVDFGYFC